MENFRALLGDVLIKTAGVRTTPEVTEESDFQVACNELILSLEKQYPKMLDVISEDFDSLDDATIVDFTRAFPRIEVALHMFTAASTRHLPEAQTNIIHRFLPIGAEATCLIAHTLGRGKDPDTFESNRDTVVLAASLMSQYPGPISANLKERIAVNATSCMQDGDLTTDFRTRCSQMLTGMISAHPKSLEHVQRLRSCPARKHIDIFAGIIFDLYAACHRSVWERLSGDKKSYHAAIQQGIGDFQPSVMSNSLS